MTDPRTAAWLGDIKGCTVREPAKDADGPILEIHGDEGRAAVEITDEAFVDGLTHMAGEIQLLLDEIDDGQP